MAKEPDMQHIDDFIAELDPAELAYLQTACAEANKKEEADEEEMDMKKKTPSKLPKKTMVPDTEDAISLEEDEEA